MPYVTLAKLKAGLPAEITAQLLDDTGAGVPDAANWAAIAAAIQEEIDGRLGQRFAVPLDPVPAVIANAAFVLAAELLYQRRGFYGEHNPWTKRADSIRGTQGQPGGQAGLLDKIAAGEVPLTTETARARPSISAITEPAKTTSAAGNMMS